MSFDPASGIGFFIVYLAPGFATLEVYTMFALVDRELKEYEKLIWSLIISTVIYYPYSIVKGIKTFEEAQGDFFIFQTILTLIIIGIFLGSVLTVINRFILQRDMVEGTAWDISFNDIPETNAGVSIFTKSGTEYFGYMKLVSIGDTLREVVLGNVKLVKRDKDFDIIELKDLNGDMLLSGDLIKNILFVYEDEEATEEEETDEED